MFINCNFKLECPSFFLTAEGIEFLQGKKKLMNFEFKESLTNIEIGDKVGIDKVVKKKKNLFDFIKDGEKESSK
jgi:hypothetical protein